MRRKIGYFFLCLFISGCLAYGRDFGTAPVKNIQNNVTTQKEIFGFFGEPVRKGLENGYETWTYSYEYYELVQRKHYKVLDIVFNKDGTVRNYSFTSK